MNTEPNDYLFESECKWSIESRSRDYGKDILATCTYSEIKELLLPLIENRLKTQNNYDSQYKKLVKSLSKDLIPDTFEHYFAITANWIIQVGNKENTNLKQLNEIINYWQAFNHSSKPNQHQFKLNDLIQLAKEVKIESLYKDQLRQIGSRLQGKCPFHEERTPSFFIFTNENKFYCFGCCEGGDVINFYSKIHNCTFIEAVKYLSNMKYGHTNK